MAFTYDDPGNPNGQSNQAFFNQMTAQATGQPPPAPKQESGPGVGTAIGVGALLTGAGAIALAMKKGKFSNLKPLTKSNDDVAENTVAKSHEAVKEKYIPKDDVAPSAPVVREASPIKPEEIRVGSIDEMLKPKAAPIIEDPIGDLMKQGMNREDALKTHYSYVKPKAEIPSNEAIHAWAPREFIPAYEHVYVDDLGKSLGLKYDDNMGLHHGLNAASNHGNFEKKLDTLMNENPQISMADEAYGSMGVYFDKPHIDMAFHRDAMSQIDEATGRRFITAHGGQIDDSYIAKSDELLFAAEAIGRGNKPKHLYLSESKTKNLEEDIGTIKHLSEKYDLPWHIYD